MASDIHRRLREATGADHVRLEARADILNHIGRLETRQALVRLGPQPYWSGDRADVICVFPEAEAYD